MVKKQTKKASTVLVEAANMKVKRLEHCLADFDFDGKPIGYCALGLLGCRAGLIKTRHDDPAYDDIWSAYGIPEDIGIETYERNDKGWSFRRIAKWLRSKGF